jgi:carbonic anhydrase/acetyltransferase-like protein (isoleucine patch superfamily)
VLIADCFLMIRSYKGILPTIPSTCYVDQSAQIIGDVVLGDHASVWMNAVVRGDVNWIRIGARSNVQDGAIVHVMIGTHPTTIGNDVTIGHGAIVHGCTLQDRILIGMGAILLNGVVVGEDSIVAAGTLLTEGTQVPPRSLVMGSPGKVRRELTSDDVETIRAYAERYVGYRLEYMNAAGTGSVR